MFRKFRRNVRGKDQILVVKYNRKVLCGGDYDLIVILGCYFLGDIIGGNGGKAFEFFFYCFFINLCEFIVINRM